MKLVVDTSVVVAVLVSEPERRVLAKAVRGAELIAPASLHWEVGNALAAMLRRRRIPGTAVPAALATYARIPLRRVEVDLGAALALAERHRLCAYDAYVLACAVEQKCGLVTLDRGLRQAARAAGVAVVEA